LAQDSLRDDDVPLVLLNHWVFVDGMP